MEGKIKFLFFLLHDLRILERKEMDGQLYIGEKYRRQNFDFSFQTLESFPGCIFPQVFAGKIKFIFFFSTIHLSADSREGLKGGNGWKTLYSGKYRREGKISIFPFPSFCGFSRNSAKD